MFNDLFVADIVGSCIIREIEKSCRFVYNKGDKKSTTAVNNILGWLSNVTTWFSEVSWFIELRVFFGSRWREVGSS